MQMTLDMGTIIQTLFGALATIAISVVGYLIKSSIDRMEADLKKVQDQETTLKLQEARIGNVETSLVGRMAILERNLETAFKKIDDLKPAPRRRG